jgi:hypothetical protein
MSLRPRPPGPVRARARATDHLAMAVGTSEGLFLVSDGVTDGPIFPGRQVTALLQHGTRYLAATIDRSGRASLLVSTDGGVRWQDPQPDPVAFPEGAGESLLGITQLQLDQSSGDENNVALFAGTQPCALFRSNDLAQTFELVGSLFEPLQSDEPKSIETSILHTILTHRDRPKRIIVGSEPGGVFKSDDAGKSWTACNPSQAIPLDRVHKLASDAGNPDGLWLQGDAAVLYSPDAGDTWENVTGLGKQESLPSGFGRCIVAHPVQPACAFVFPLASKDFPVNPSGRCVVYRSYDRGETWQALGEGLPATAAYLSVNREAFTIGASAPYPLALGTTTGRVYASVDSGESWRLFVDNLPPVLCLRVLD